MKIEKINDSQIRFILTEEDLEARQIKLSELAYGTDKARNLFREMMQQAADRFHFDVNNIPLMIEAVPMRSGSIVLIVSKVDHPEELDTRFSNFAPSMQRPSTPGETGTTSFDQLLNTLIADRGEDNESGDTGTEAGIPAGKAAEEAMRQYRDFAIRNRLYAFSSMDNVLKAASLVGTAFKGDSLLFRDDGAYTLLLKMKSAEEASAMQQVLAVLSEYGNVIPVSYAREQYLEEHGDVMISSDALSKLSKIAG